METATDTVQQNVFTLPKYNLSALDERLKKLSRRAKKLGVEAPSYEILREFDKEYKVDKEVVFRIRLVEIQVDGPVVKANGWNFVASVEHTEAGNAIKKVPGFEGEIPHEYREGWPVCDHCNTKRRRKGSYLCLNEGTGEWKQVGRNCLGDFLGRDPTHAVWGLTTWDEIATCCEYDDDCFYGNEGCGYWSFSFTEFLTAVFFYVRKFGWVSRGAARCTDATSTSDHAWWLVSPSFTRKEQMEKEEEKASIPEADMQRAMNALVWTRETLGAKDSESRSDYEQNLFIALSKPGVEQSDMGIVASLVVGYNRHIERVIEEKAKESKSNEWLWEEGKRVKDVVLTLVKQRSIESDFGASILHTFEDEKGNQVIWWGSKYAEDQDTHKEADVGDKVSASWTVKKHSEYKGRKQTAVFRPAKMKVIVEKETAK